MPDSTLYLYTSLTAGSSHIVTATARVETILKANKLPFQAVDVATDEAARKLWGRRSKGKKLPGLVKYGDIVGDLEQIEEWNEFGELRMVVNSVQDLGGMPATSNPLPASESKTEPEPKTPKPSTIKIQNPPVVKAEEKKDEMTVLALRQASQEAASQAKSKADEKKAPKQADNKPSTEEAPASPSLAKGHRGSVAPELPDTPDSPVGKRPALVVPEDAAVSSANFHVENAEILGLVEHHRGSIISASDKGAHDKTVSEIRQSVSGKNAGGDIDALREEAALKQSSEVPIVEEKGTAEEVKSKAENEAAEAAEKASEKEEKEEEEKKVGSEEKEEKKEDAKEDQKEAADAESKTEAVSKE